LEMWTEFLKWSSRIPISEWVIVLCLIGGGTVFVALLLSRFKSQHVATVWSPPIVWLILTACIHCFIEVQFVVARNSWFAHAVDLYGAGDLRYGRPLEAGTAAMEAMTAFITGPLCFAAAWSIVVHSAWRHILVLIASTCQLYGLVWFIIQPFFSSEKLVSDDKVLFYTMVVGFNAPWGIIPPIMAYRSFRELLQATTAALENENLKRVS